MPQSMSSGGSAARMRCAAAGMTLPRCPASVAANCSRTGSPTAGGSRKVAAYGARLRCTPSLIAVFAPATSVA